MNLNLLKIEPFISLYKRNSWNQIADNAIFSKMIIMKEALSINKPNYVVCTFHVKLPICTNVVKAELISINQFHNTILVQSSFIV